MGVIEYGSMGVFWKRGDDEWRRRGYLELSIYWNETIMLMREPIRDFKQLRVYGEAFELAMEIFRISSDWPKPERYALPIRFAAPRGRCAPIWVKPGSNEGIQSIL